MYHGAPVDYPSVPNHGDSANDDNQSAHWLLVMRNEKMDSLKMTNQSDHKDYESVRSLYPDQEDQNKHPEFGWSSQQIEINSRQIDRTNRTLNEATNESTTRDSHYMLARQRDGNPVVREAIEAFVCGKTME